MPTSVRPIELRDRLPLCWAQVMAGNLRVWKARRIAEQTIPLTAKVAEAVDTSLAPFASEDDARAGSCGRWTPRSCATTPSWPRSVRKPPPRSAAPGSTDRLDGTTDLSALLDTPDAHALDHALDTVATTLGRLGDHDARDVRRARALGVLADPQYALDLHDAASRHRHRRPPTRSAPTCDAHGRRHRLRRTKRLSPTLHVHLHLDALQATDAVRDLRRSDAERDAAVHLGRVDKAGRQLGARSLAVIERWIAGLTPGTTLKLTPVVDLTELISVDAYEIPPPLRRQVAERDHHCRFPWCTNAGRYDIDHIDAYLDPDDGGPPGQTNTHNLARLCRYHHRVKTRGDWHYTHDPTTGVLTWTSPQGRTYTVDEHGTYPQPLTRQLAARA